MNISTHWTTEDQIYSIGSPYTVTDCTVEEKKKKSPPGINLSPLQPNSFYWDTRSQHFSFLCCWLLHWVMGEGWVAASRHKGPSFAAQTQGKLTTTCAGSLMGQILKKVLMILNNVFIEKVKEIPINLQERTGKNLKIQFPQAGKNRWKRCDCTQVLLQIIYSDHIMFLNQWHTVKSTQSVLHDAGAYGLATDIWIILRPGADGGTAAQWEIRSN